MRYTREKAAFVERHVIIETEIERTTFNDMVQLVLDTATVTEGNRESAVWNMAYSIKYGV